MLFHRLRKLRGLSLVLIALFLYACGEDTSRQLAGPDSDSVPDTFPQTLSLEDYLDPEDDDQMTKLWEQIQRDLYQSLFDRGRYEDNPGVYQLTSEVRGAGTYTGRTVGGESFDLAVTGWEDLTQETLSFSDLTVQERDAILSTSAEFSSIEATISTQKGSTQIHAAVSSLSSGPNRIHTLTITPQRKDFEAQVLPKNIPSVTGTPGDWADQIRVADCQMDISGYGEDADPDDWIECLQCSDPYQPPDLTYCDDREKACRDAKDCVKDADLALAKCIKYATIAYLATMAVCAALAIITWWVGGAGGAACAIRASVAYVAALVICEMIHESNLRDCQREYRQDLRDAIDEFCARRVAAGC